MGPCPRGEPERRGLRRRGPARRPPGRCVPPLLPAAGAAPGGSWPRRRSSARAAAHPPPPVQPQPERPAPPQRRGHRGGPWLRRRGPGPDRPAGRREGGREGAGPRPLGAGGCAGAPRVRPAPAAAGGASDTRRVLWWPQSRANRPNGAAGTDPRPLSPTAATRLLFPTLVCWQRGPAESESCGAVKPGQKPPQLLMLGWARAGRTGESSRTGNV